MNRNPEEMAEAAHAIGFERGKLGGALHPLPPQCFDEATITAFKAGWADGDWARRSDKAPRYRASGHWETCACCEKRVSVTAAGKFRIHHRKGPSGRRVLCEASGKPPGSRPPMCDCFPASGFAHRASCPVAEDARIADAEALGRA